MQGRAGDRARRSQPGAAAARPVVPGRRLDRFTRHHRRHDREQLLRRALAALRQHARERPVDRRYPGRRQQGALRPGRARPVRPAGHVAAQAGGARSVRAGRAGSGGGGGAFSQGSAPGRRLQHRFAGAGAQRRQSRAHPGRLGRHAGVLHRGRIEALPGARTPRGRRRSLRQLSRGDGGGAAHRQAGAHRGRARRTRP